MASSLTSLRTRMVGLAIRWGLVFVLLSALISLTVEGFLQWNRLQETVDSIIDSETQRISDALWVVDLALVQSHLSGIVRDDLVSYAAVTEANGTTFAAGTAPQRPVAVREARLTYSRAGTEREIGTLVVQGDLRAWLLNALEYGLLGALYPAIAFLVVGIFLNRAFFRLVVDRILTVDKYLRTVDPNRSTEPLSMDGKVPEPPPKDELEAVAIAINEMRDSIYAQHKALMEARDLAEREVQQRTRELILTNTTLEQQVRQLHETKERLTRADQSRTMFLANMSHEIRTPITGIVGLANLISRTELTDPQREYVRNVIASAESLLGIVDDLLDLSKLDGGRIELVRERVDIRTLLEEVVSLLEASALRGGVDVRLEITPDVPAEIELDPIRLQQIVRNLLGNALKYTPEGSVVVRTRCTAPSELTIAVEDTGIGIPEDALVNLFDSFFQVDSSYRKKYKGSGLGLSISRRLAELMGGRIEVESEEGVGSTFRVVLPIAVPAVTEDVTAIKSGTAALDHPAGGSPNSARRILVAEDNLINLMYLKQLLIGEGHEVETAKNGYQAIERARETSFDLILLDIQMPELDGVEAMRTISAETTVPIVALTAYARATEREEFLSAGFSAVVTKPVNEAELRRAIQELGHQG